MKKILEITKSELSTKVSKNIAKYPIISQLEAAVLEEIKKATDTQKALEIPIVRKLYTNSGGVKNFETQLQEIGELVNIASPMKRLSSNLVGEFQSVWAEIYEGMELKKENKQNIKFAPVNAKYDLSFQDTDDSDVRLIEVKDLRKIDPAMDILVNKFEAKSILDKRFNRMFVTSCEYPEFPGNKVNKIHEKIEKAVDQILHQLSSCKNLSKVNIKRKEIYGFRFSVKSKKTYSHCVLIHSGGTGRFAPNNPGEFFPQLASVYERIIKRFYEGYMQLLEERKWNKDLVSTDLLIMHLKIGGFARVFSDNVERTILDMTKSLGMNKMVKIKYRYV